MTNQLILQDEKPAFGAYGLILVDRWSSIDIQCTEMSFTTVPISFMMKWFQESER